MCDNGCGQHLPRGVYSDQKNTWSCNSNLRMVSWDPYPDLQNPKNCYGNNVTEGYCNCSNNDCGLYDITPNKIDSTYVPLRESVSVGGVRFSNPGRMIAMARSGKKEFFEGDTRCNPNSNYKEMKQTWSPQRPFGWFS